MPWVQCDFRFIISINYYYFSFCHYQLLCEFYVIYSLVHIYINRTSGLSKVAYNSVNEWSYLHVFLYNGIGLFLIFLNKKIGSKVGRIWTMVKKKRNLLISDYEALNFLNTVLHGKHVNLISLQVLDLWLRGNIDLVII